MAASHRRPPDYGQLAHSPAHSHESLVAAQNIPPVATRSFSMPSTQLPLSPSAASLNDYGLSPAARLIRQTRSRPAYVRGGSTITPFNVMSDDEREKQTFEPAASNRAGTDEASTREESLSKKKDDRAEKVRKMVQDAKRKCARKESRIRSLEERLSAALTESRHITEDIFKYGDAINTRRTAIPSSSASPPARRSKDAQPGPYLFEILQYGIPRQLKVLHQAEELSHSVDNRIHDARTDMDRADVTYEKLRQKASALEQHLQWRTTPWYIKAKAYLRGERKLNWYDTSAHRTQALAQIAIWLLVTLAVIAVVISSISIWFYWNRS